MTGVISVACSVDVTSAIMNTTYLYGHEKDKNEQPDLSFFLTLFVFERSILTGKWTNFDRKALGM